MLRRETIIALRARHTAFRIALEILNPPQTPPPMPPPLVSIPYMPLPDQPYSLPRWPLWQRVIGCCAILLLLAYLIAIAMIFT